MDEKNQLFLQALKAALKNEKVSWDMNMTPQNWLELFSIASIHQVLPMIYETVYNCPAAKRLEPQFLIPFKQQAVRAVMLQTMKTSEFLSLFQHLQKADVEPLVVKGIVCRSLYPNPDYRMSGDEDVLVVPEQFELCHKAMLDYGMQPSDPAQDIQSVYEVPYGKPGSRLYIELHKSLFPPESDAYGDFNRFFMGIWDRAVQIPIDGVPISTMGYTDHLLYLICHAFKHFLHSGFGIRQVCDITLFANTYGKEINWTEVLEHCKEIHAELFAVALFQIGRKYLTFDPDAACYPVQWRNIQVDETMMLEDLLDAGIYGGGTMSRKHSSNITLNAVSAQKQGRKAGNHILKSVFPSAKNLEARYPYLKKHPYLLPVAWINRILKYRKEASAGSSNNAAAAVAIGNRRLALLKQYRIIDS